MATRFVYADPMASVFIGFMILLTAIPLLTRSSKVLLEGAPTEIDLKGVEKDLLAIPGVEGIHEMHVWQLKPGKNMATVHIMLDDECSIKHFEQLSHRISEVRFYLVCLAASASSALL
jgi:zinc transporter 1